MMEKGRESMTSLSEEELQKEADTVREMMKDSAGLHDVEVPEEVHKRLAERIRKYEEERAVEGLSEKDREALRLGREMQEQSEKKVVVYRPKKRKVWVMLAAVLVMVVGIGMTSVGGKKIIVDVFEKNFGGSEKTYVDTNETTLPTTEEGMSEEEAYDEVEQAFGTKVVRIVDKPENMHFLEMQLDQEVQETTFYYSAEDKILSYRIVFPYAESSSGMEIPDEFQQEYVLELPETDVVISEYKIQDTGELEYLAQFTYKASQYFLTGIMNREDFEKVVKNLFFF